MVNNGTTKGWTRGILLDYDIMKKRVHNEPGFIAMRRYSYDISKLENRYDECPNHVIGQALLLSDGEVKDEIDKVTAKLRNLMGIQVEV